jgi:hypothetical protein
VPLPAASAVRALLGCEPHEATADHIRRLLTVEVRENDWLDYKRALPRDVAKCVAALANAAGGVLIVGIEEERGTRRPLLVGCADPAAKAEQLGLTVAASVFPHPRFEITTVPIDGTAVLVVHVPRSSLAPHACQKPGEDAMTYPMRNGITTRYLREPEVADRYRARFLRQVEEGDRLKAIVAQGVQRLPAPLGPWLVLASLPEQPGQLSLSSTSGPESWSWLTAWSTRNNWPKAIASSGKIFVARRRVVLLPHGNVVLELHNDGSFFGAALLSVPPDTDSSVPFIDPFTCILAPDLDSWVLTLLNLASDYAYLRARAGGDLSVLAHLQGARVPKQALELLVEDWVGGYTRTGVHVPVSDPTPALHVVPESVVESKPDLISAAASIVIDLVSEFGEAEPAYVRFDGELPAEGHGTSPRTREIVENLRRQWFPT